MIEAYMQATLDVLRLAGQMFLARMDDQLRWFSDDLRAFIFDLERNPRRDWRERFDAMLAEQASRACVITPESRATLIAYLEVWEQNVFGGPPQEKPPLKTVITRVDEETPPAPLPVTETTFSMLAPRRSADPGPPTKKPAWWRPPAGDLADFYSKVDDARSCIYDLERMLPAIANRIEAAPADEPFEIDAELTAVDSLIWRHNDLMESAREIWLRKNLGNREFAELDLGPNPASLGLPLFTDKQQADRAKAQTKKIGERLNQKIAFFDNVIFTMEMIEWAGTIASFALAGGILIQAARQGAKILLIKSVAMAASYAASKVIGEATGAALKAVGLEDEQIAQIQNTVELVSMLLLLRKVAQPKKPNLRPKRQSINQPSELKLEDPKPASRAMTPYRDPQRPNYNTAATHNDHAQARALDGPDKPSNLRPLPAESNLRKGGYEGELKRYRDKLIRAGMSKEDAQAVIQPEIDALRRSVVARPTDPKVLDSLPDNPSDQGHPF